jgi:hypothetical protein
MRTTILILACATLVFIGCRKRSAPVAAAPAPAESSATPAATAPAPQSGGPAPALVTTQASNDAAYIQEMTQTLNDFLADYIRQHKRVPRDINEMMSLKLITSIPVLPGGKKWVINQQTGKISAQ